MEMGVFLGQPIFSSIYTIIKSLPWAIPEVKKKKKKAIYSVDVIIASKN